MAAIIDVDSRQYIIARELRSDADVPPDFDRPEALSDFQAGLFLPRDKPDWFGRSSYPPRVAALVPAGLAIVPHPSAKEPAQFVSFERLCFVESGHMLLRGWVRFVGHDFDRTLFYNTTGARAVGGFLRKLRTAFLATSADSLPGTTVDLGQPLDLKFQYLRAQEVDPGEGVRASLFRPATELHRRLFILKRKRSVPADLVAFTASRLLWITDRDRNGYARYGSIARYAPLAKITGICRTGEALRVVFDSCGRYWRIPVAAEHWDAAAWFEQAWASTQLSGFALAQPAPQLFEHK
jgi:hypothetical protein